MVKQEIITLLKEKIKTAKYNNEGVAIISISEVGDGADMADVLEDLKADCTLDFDLDLDKMTLKIHNVDDDIEGFVAKHPSPQPCDKILT
ncbi:hypothetical protein [Acetobacterium bakii]|uniref:Uncharacterized protein n=1 Tax=Acetobacterium bakii TaxID=52689 RepID=A0A0L6U4F0_9FIRM|nr:hypothetical protein [Acetobacterium bakii]KNZ42690.1 hypothetical protein AKG39_04965 [Acetobacterium bakii]